MSSDTVSSPGAGGAGDAGPLHGIRVVELAGIGPAPFAAMLLADMGADVVRVDRPRTGLDPARARVDVVNRGKRSVSLDLKDDRGREAVLRLTGTADVLVEGFRPGVTERLGLGPDECMGRNPRLVYGRMTGWGQTGPLADRAGHDVNYVALTGALWACGRSDERPAPALNLVGDYGGGAMFLVFGVACALLERERSGRGQVVDAAMVDGVTTLTAMFSSLRAMGLWKSQRGVNLLDTGAPFYEVYECADGRYLSVGALEPQFYSELVRRSGFRRDVPEPQRTRQPAPDAWNDDKQEWADLFRTRTRDEWAALLADADTCVQPVLDWDEAAAHPHIRARQVQVDTDGVRQPAPAPRFSRSPVRIGAPPPLPGQHTRALLEEAGFDEASVTALLEAGVAEEPSR